MNSKTAHLVNRQFHYTWLFSSCIRSPWCAKDFRCLFGFSVSGAEAVQTSRNPVPSRWLTTIGNSSSRGSKVWTHSHTLDSLRKPRGSSWIQAEKGHTPGLLAVFIAGIITSTTWLFHSWLSTHLLPLREAGAGARTETREEPPDWLVPHGFLILLSYTTQKQLSEVALLTVDQVLPHQSISNILHRPIW